MGLFDWLSKKSGFRWSVYVTTTGKELRYVLHGNSARALAMRVASYFKDGSAPVPPWSLYMNFNRQHKAFELMPSHFGSDGQTISEALRTQFSSLDSDWAEFSGGADQIFIDAATKETLELDPSPITAESIEQRIRDIQSGCNGNSRRATFYSVMDEVFGRR